MRSSADSDLQITGGRGGRGGPDPEIRGAVSKTFFSALWASVWSKNKGRGPSPGSTTEKVGDERCGTKVESETNQGKRIWEIRSLF